MSCLCTILFALVNMKKRRSNLRICGTKISISRVWAYVFRISILFEGRLFFYNSTRLISRPHKHKISVTRFYKGDSKSNTFSFNAQQSFSKFITLWFTFLTLFLQLLSTTSLLSLFGIYLNASKGTVPKRSYRFTRKKQ